VQNTSIALNWCEALKRLLFKPHLLEKHYNHMGFPTAHRSLENIAKSIHECVEVINNHGWNGRYQITNPLTDNFGQEELNQLHHHFETLIGQVWNRASWFDEATHEAQVAILMLNNYIHEYEYKKRAIQRLKEFGRDRVSSSLVCAFTAAERYDLSKQDLKEFSLERSFGDVYLHYSQLGKTHEEAFNDDDQIVGGENIQGLRYYSGEFDVYLGEDSHQDYQVGYERDFKNWISKQGLEPNNSELRLGEIKVASLTPRKNQKDWSRGDFQEAIAKRDSLTHIRLKEGLKSWQAHFPYSADEVRELMIHYFKNGSWKSI